MLSFFDNNSKSTVDKYMCNYNNNWDISVDGSTTSYNKIPTKIENKTRSQVTYEKLLPSDIKNGDSILFYTNHQSVEVFIGNKLVYEFKTKEDSISKTPGNGWHFIRLDKGNVGSNIKITLTPSYNKVAGFTPDFLFGRSEALLGYIMRSNAISLFLCAILFVLGILLLLSSYIYKRKLEVSEYIKLLGFLSVMVSIWSLAELDIIPLFLGNHILNSQITYIGLKLTYIPLMTYIGKIYDSKKSRFFNLLAIISLADIFITIVLQVLGIGDFKETIIVFHVLLSISAGMVIFTNTKELVFGKDKLKDMAKTHLLSMLFLFACIFADFYRYYAFHSKDNSVFTKLGILSYIFVLLYLAVNRSIKLIQTNEQLDRIKQIASHDPITQLHNRTAFQEDINAILQADYSEYGVAVFDLNDLKEFNDLYGHSVGDYYIIISSEVIQDVFGKYGTVYRIGGDEFCAIMTNVLKSDFRSLEDKMNKRVEGLNGVYFAKNMSIASGYAVYNPKYDISLNDTFQRADKNMYKDKNLKKGSYR